MKKKVALAGLALLFFGCAPKADEAPAENLDSLNGNWKGILSLNDSTELPFIFSIANGKGNAHTILNNGVEKIMLETEYIGADSVVMNFPIYQSRLVATFTPSTMTGFFEKTDSKDYRVPFKAEKGFKERELADTMPCCKIAPRWQVTFTNGEKQLPAIGEFALVNNSLRGTFLTESGDYRYLEGTLSNRNFTLYGFDGGFLQVFKGTLETETSLVGHYYSGLTGYQTFTAAPSATYQLANPEEISELRQGVDSISFSYPGIDGNPVAYNPARYKGKVVLLQITGSWCPNCKDQGAILQKLQDYLANQVVVLGVAFERMGTLEASIAAAKKAKTGMGTSYPVGIAQYSRDQDANKVFPFLEKIRGYPTLIIIDKKGSVRKIYTGFAGPGTTQYDEVTNYLVRTVQDLVNE